jgi:hypothetical protein
MAEKMLDPNLGQVSVVKVMDEECRDCMDDCKQHTWTLTIGGLVLVEAMSPHGLLNFLETYIPDLAASINGNEEAIVRAKEIYGKLQVMKGDLQGQAEQYDRENPINPDLDFEGGWN